uniref:Subtilisin-like protease fibronectin type-III domain-containing protein n=1 Tax=Oryza nivara TaxID=4536 RepID=A0A0E0GXA5_ORYNI
MPIQANERVQNIADPFEYVAGFLDLVMVPGPGFIYDITASDYLKLFNCMGVLGSGDDCPTAFFQVPTSVEMVVEPPVFVFNKDRRVQSFRVTFKATWKVQGDYRFGSLAWHDGGSYWVQIPIAVRIVIQEIYSKIS